MAKYDLVSIPKLRQLINDAAKCENNTERFGLIAKCGIPGHPKFLESGSIYHTADGKVPNDVWSVDTLLDALNADFDRLFDLLDVDPDPEYYAVSVLVFHTLRRCWDKSFSGSRKPLKKETFQELRNSVLNEILDNTWHLITIYKSHDPICDHAVANSVVEEILMEFDNKIRDIARDPDYLSKHWDAQEKEKQKQALTKEWESLQNKTDKLLARHRTERVIEAIKTLIEEIKDK